MQQAGVACVIVLDCKPCCLRHNKSSPVKLDRSCHSIPNPTMWAAKIKSHQDSNRSDLLKQAFGCCKPQTKLDAILNGRDVQFKVAEDLKSVWFESKTLTSSKLSNDRLFSV